MNEINEKNMAKHKPWKKAMCVLLSVIIAFGTLITLTVGSSRLQDWLGIKSMLSAYAAEIVDTTGAVAVDEESMLADNNIIDLENSDGSNTIYLFSEPISFTDENGNLKTKDISVEKQSDRELKKQGYEYTNGQNDYRINFSEDINQGLLIESGSCTYSIIPQTEYKSAQGKENVSEYLGDTFETFEYSGAFGAGTSLKFYPQLNGIKDEIVLNQNIDKTDFSFELKTENCTASLNDDGTVTLVNANGENVQTFSAPFAYDSEYVEGIYDEHYSGCTYTLEQTGTGTYILSVHVDAGWLDSSDTVYPVVIDPTTSHIGNMYDLPIHTKRTTTGATVDNNAVGTSTEMGTSRSLIKFQKPSEIKAYAKINSAYYWTRELTGRTSAFKCGVYKITSSWNEKSLWTTRPTYNGTMITSRNINSASKDYEPSPYWYKFNITSLVQQWYTGTTNYGFMMKYENESASAKNLRTFAQEEYSSSAWRPYTVINYTNDATAPTVTSVTGNATSWTSSNVTLTVNGAKDNSGGVGMHSTPYLFSTTKGNYSWQASKSKTFSSNCTVYIYVRDAYNNIRLVSTQTISKIDKSAPTPPTVTGNPTEWTNSNITLTAASTDSDSGIAAYSFSTTEGVYAWQTGKTKTVSANTTYYVYAKDNAGNISAAKAVHVNKIDKTAPSVPTISYDSEAWANTDVTLTASSTDSESGIAQYSFSSKADEYEWQTEDYKIVSEVSKIYVSAKDNAGNISEPYEVKLNIDKVSPDGSVTSDKPENWVKSVTITADASDGESGLHETAYSFSTEEGVYNWQAKNTKTITSNGTIYVYVRDSAGNITLLDTVVVEKVDSAAPTINDIHVEDIGDKTVITIDAEDPLSGICQYSIDNGVTWQSDNVFEIEKDSLNYLSVKVSDNIGNKTALAQYYDIYKPQMYYEDGKFGFYNPNPNCECDIYYSYAYSSYGGWKKYEEPIPIKENQRYIFASFYYPGMTKFFQSADYRYTIDTELTSDIFDYTESSVDYSLTYNSAQFDIARQYKDGKWSFSVQNGLTFVGNNSMIKVVTPDFNELSFIRKSRYLYVNEVNGYELTVVYNEEDTEIAEYILKYGDYNYHYNTSGQLVKISNAYGDLFTFTRNVRYTTITDGAGRVTTLVVLKGVVKSVTDANGGTISYTYSNGNSGNLVQVMDQAGVILGQYEYTGDKLTKSNDKSITYDANGRITEYLLDNGYSTKFEYSDNTVTVTTSDEKTTSVTYDFYGSLSSSTDEYGDVTTYTYDDNHNLTEVKKNKKVLNKYTYDEDGRLTYKMEDGKEYTYSYDSKGRLIHENDPDHSYTYYYDDNDRVSVKVEGSVHTYYLYDDKGNVTFSGQIDSKEAYAPYYYDESCEFESVFKYTYENGKLIKTEDVDNHSTTVNTYDSYGNVIKTTTTVENEDGSESIGITQDTYDILDRLISTKSNDKETTYTYDRAGRTLLVNADGECTRTVYDNLGRVIQEIGSDDYDPALDDLPVDYLDYDVGHRYYYDSVGNLVKEINKYDIVTDYTYSSVGTLEKKSFDIYDYYYNKDGTCDRVDVSGETIVDYDYNVTDSTVNTKDGEILNRITYADGYTQEEMTDKYGSLLGKYNEDGIYFAFLGLFSSNNKLTYKNHDTDEFITTISEDDSYTYSRGRIYGEPTLEYQVSTQDDVTTIDETHFEKEFKTVINENNISYTSAGGTVNLTYDSDEDAQTATQTIQNGDSTIFSADYSYNEEDEKYVKSYSVGSKTYFSEYDDDGNIIADERNTYTYNEYGELVAVTGESNSSYTYDDRGNMLTKTVDGETTSYSYENTDWKDQITAVNGVELTYDANGNLKSYGEKQYTWNYGKSLGTVTDGDDTYAYAYDENGIRTSKTINGVTTEINTVNGKVLAQKTGEDILYFLYDSSDVPVGFVYNDAAYYYITNISNDVVGITDSAGNIIAEYEYDEWGKLISVEAESEETQAIAQMNPLRYRGYYYDNETGYYYLQSRYYDPGLGRFISADDFAYVDASGKFSINAYAYCANNPVNFSDPLGNAYVSEAGKVVGKIIPTIYLLFDAVKLDVDFAYYLGGAIILDSDYIFKQSSLWYKSFKQDFKNILNSVLYKSIKVLDPNIFYEFFINAKNKKESKLIKDFGIKTVTIEYRRTSLKDSLKSFFGDIQQSIMENISERITNIKTITNTEYSIFYNITTTLIMLPNYFIINTLKFFQSGNIYISESENDYYNYPPGAVATAIFTTVFGIITTLFKAFSTNKGKVFA